MNEKEQMEALLAGKIVMCDGERYRLDEDGDDLEYMGSMGEWREFEHILINSRCVSVLEEGDE